MEQNMPWIGALIIGLLSVLVNFWVAHRLRQSNERNLTRQIENAKEITLSQFKSTIATKNRQDWINELRNAISDAISQSMLISLERLGKDDIDSLKRNFEKFLFSKAKVEMLLNVDKPEQKVIIDGMDKLLKNCLKDKNTFSTEEAKKERDEIIEASRKLFGIHWKKIKEQK